MRAFSTISTPMPSIIKDAKVVLLDSALEIKEPETDAKIQITDPAQLHAFIEQEEKTIKEMVEKIISIGANVVFCQKGIDDLAQHYLAKAGIYAVRRVSKSDLEALAKATGTKIVAKVNELKEIWKAIREIRQHLQEDDFKVIIPCDIDEGGFKLS